MSIRRRRWPGILAGAFVAVVVAAVVSVVVAYPAMASSTCPGCYGLTELEPRIHTEPDLSAPEQRRIIETVDRAEQRVTYFYGSREAHPRILVCTTSQCYQRIGGGQERGVAVLNRAVMVSPRGTDAVILSHEMSHVELHQRLHPTADTVPQWFDEGLAVLISNDPRYLRPATEADRCRSEPVGQLPASLEDWLGAASRDQMVYAQAACRVSRWVDGHGGRRAVPDLIRRLNHGEPFTRIVPPGN